MIGTSAWISSSLGKLSWPWLKGTTTWWTEVDYKVLQWLCNDREKESHLLFVQYLIWQLKWLCVESDWGWCGDYLNLGIKMPYILTAMKWWAFPGEVCYTADNNNTSLTTGPRTNWLELNELTNSILSGGQELSDRPTIDGTHGTTR